MAKLTSVFVGVLVIAAFNAELRLTDAGPVPQLSVKLLCELLCEHCNGVPNMESGHCNCQVPEAHFKDNAACLERVQISAAEMNLKLTHTAFKNNRRKRSSNESYRTTPTYLGRGKRSAQLRFTYDTQEYPITAKPESENIDRDTNNFQELGRGKRSAPRRSYDTHEHPITAKPVPENMDRDTNNFQELGRGKRSASRRSYDTHDHPITAKPEPENMDRDTNNSQELGRGKHSAQLRFTYDTHEHPITAKPEPENMDRDTNNSQELGRSKRSAARIFTFDTHEHPITALPEPENMDRDRELMPQSKYKKDLKYSNKTMLEIANSFLFRTEPDDTAQSQQGLHAAKRSVTGLPTSSGETMYSKTAINAMPSSNHLSDSELRSSKPSILDTRRNKRSTTNKSEFDIDEDKAMPRREISVSNDNGDVDFQFDADITIPMFPFGRASKENSPNPKLQDEADSQLQNKPTSEAENPNAFVSNKFRNTGEDDNTGVLSKSSSLLPEIKPLVLIPSTLSPPTTFQAMLRTPNEKTSLQMAKLNDLKLKLPTLFSIDQPRSPFHSLLQTNTLLKEPKPLIQLQDNTPLAKIRLLNPLSKPSLPLSRSQNNALNDLITKSYVNRLTPVQPEGMTVLERIRNYQTKLKQRLAESRSADNLVKPLPLKGCLFKHADSGLTPKLNLLSSIPTRSYKSMGDCDDGTNLKAPPTDFLEKIRSKLGNTDGLPQTLPNESALRTGKTQNRNEETVQLSQSTENTNKNGNIPNISSPPLDLSALGNILNTTPGPTANHPSYSDADQHPQKFQVHQLETTPMGHLAPSESTVGPILKDVEDKSHHTTQTVGPSLMGKDTIQTLSDHPHFLNHNDDGISPNHFPSLLVQPTLANIMHLSPEDRYRAMFDPTAFQNSMQHINYPALLARNDLSGAMRGSYQNVPLVLVPNSAVPFDHPSHFMTPFNGGYTPTNLPHNEPSGIIMRAFVPGDHPGEHLNSPAIPSSVFVMSPVPMQGGNIPYPDLLNQLRTGNAIVQIHPVDLDHIDK